MSIKVPDTQFGVISSKDTSKVQALPVPKPGVGEVLIQNFAVASNPKDWKLSKQSDYAFVEGNDVAGLVVAVGEGVTEFKGGERVAAFTKMGTKDNKYGAYQQYTVAPASLTFPIPETTFEEAATLPLAAMTAAIGLFVNLGLPEPPKPGSGSGDGFAPARGKGVIIYGASTSVGAYAIQLAKRAGFFLVGVAGSSGDYVKSLGADVVIDYRAHRGEGELEAALVRAVEGHPTLAAYDVICLHGTSLLLARVLAKTAPDGKGRVTYLSDDEKAQLPQGITEHRTFVGSAYGEDEAFASRFYRQISAWLTPGPGNPRPFRPNNVRVLPHGLASVEEGLRMLQNDEVHAEKLVYRIADTPGLKV